jgi:N-acetyl-anhydromuramyl-L-alanine amidase AmpD
MAQMILDQLLAFDSHFRPQATSGKPQAASCDNLSHLQIKKRD